MSWLVSDSIREVNQEVDLLSKWNLKWKADGSGNIKQGRLKGILWAEVQGIHIIRHGRPTDILT